MTKSIEDVDIQRAKFEILYAWVQVNLRIELGDETVDEESEEACDLINEFLSRRQKEILVTYVNCGYNGASAGRQLGVSRWHVSRTVKHFFCALRKARESSAADNRV